jgi:hypothetical protein
MPECLVLVAIASAERYTHSHFPLSIISLVFEYVLIVLLDNTSQDVDFVGSATC